MDTELWWEDFSIELYRGIELAKEEGLTFYQIDANKVEYYETLKSKLQAFGYRVSLYWNCAGGDTIYITW